MACYHPSVGFRSKTGRNPATGKWPIVFNVKDGFYDKPVIIPCGKCIGCRLEHSKKWAIRCVHEAEMHEENSFITLTYDDEHLDKNVSLNKRDFVLFMKKLRKESYRKLKFFHCGEYGEKGARPHHHACIFGFSFYDRELWTVKNGVKLYTSKLLQRLWPYGYSTIGDVTFESAAYVARYIMKKVTGEKAYDHYGERIPEYVTMSKGIGKTWMEKYKDDLKREDSVIIRGGIRVALPRYYERIYDEKELLDVKAKRLASSHDEEWERLLVKEKLLKLKTKNLKRCIE